jgi:hypothetical protein
MTPGIILSEAWSEPMWLSVTDKDSGFVKTWEPAPRLRCARCGRDTSRTRIVEVQTHPGARFRLVEEAECPTCAKQRAGVQP